MKINPRELFHVFIGDFHLLISTKKDQEENQIERALCGIKR